MINLESQISNEILNKLTNAGFIKIKRGYLFPISKEVSGVLSPVISTLYTNPKTYKVNATVGIRHDVIEKHLRQSKSNESTETFSVFLGYVCPDRRFKEWFIYPDNLEGIHDFLNSIMQYAVPFMRNNTSLESIKAILESDEKNRHGDVLSVIKKLLARHDRNGASDAK